MDTGVSLSGGMDFSSVYGAVRKLQKLNLARSASTLRVSRGLGVKCCQ